MTKYIVRDPATQAIIATRKTERTYTHAIRVWGDRPCGDRHEGNVTNWCGRLDLARKCASGLNAYGYKTEILPVEEVAPKPAKVTKTKSDPMRTAHFRNDIETLQLWISPSLYGVRPCKSSAEARAMVDATGVSQSLVESDRETAAYINRT